MIYFSGWIDTSETKVYSRFMSSYIMRLPSPIEEAEGEGIEEVFEMVSTRARVTTAAECLMFAV